MPPTIVALPARAGSMRFTDDDVTAVIDLLRQCETGQAVRLTDQPDESDNTARRRAELLKEQIVEKNGTDPIKTGYKVRGHVLTAGDPTVKERKSEKTGKTYKITAYPENWAAVSLVPESEPEPATPEADADADASATAETNAATANSAAADARSAPDPGESGESQSRRRRG